MNNRRPRHNDKRRTGDVDQLTVIIPLTISGLIAEDEFPRVLAILLMYAPYTRDPTRFRPLLAAAILEVAAVAQEPSQ